MHWTRGSDQSLAILRLFDSVDLAVLSEPSEVLEIGILLQVLEFKSFDLVVDSLGIADSFADFAGSDQVLESRHWHWHVKLEIDTSSSGST